MASRGISTWKAFEEKEEDEYFISINEKDYLVPKEVWDLLMSLSMEKDHYAMMLGIDVMADVTGVM